MTIGSRYTVKRRGRRYCRRFMDMGFTEGTEFEVIKTTPFGDPVVVRIRGYEVAVRKKDLKNMCL